MQCYICAKLGNPERNPVANCQAKSGRVLRMMEVVVRIEDNLLSNMTQVSQVASA